MAEAAVRQKDPKAVARARKPRLNSVVFAAAIEELMAGPTTRAELAEHTGLHWCTVNLFLTTLHRRGLIHVAAWEKDSRGRRCLAAFEFGRGKDVPKPPPMTRAAAQRAYKQRKAREDALRASAGRPAAGSNVFTLAAP